MAHYNPESGRGLFGQLTGLWNRLPANFRLNLENNFLPENPMDRPVPGEEVLLEIRIARYRDWFSHVVLDYAAWLAGAALVLTALLGLVLTLIGQSLWWLLLSPLLLLYVGYVAVRERITYVQWRLVRTNARLVISLPQHGAWPLIDNIELDGLPRVVDSNWSRNPIWRIFQAVTGARDLYLSLVGYQFAEGSARVTGALIIPDVMPGDVFALKQLVFRAPAKGEPNKVVFAEPQRVIVAGLSERGRQELESLPADQETGDGREEEAGKPSQS